MIKTHVQVKETFKNIHKKRFELTDQMYKCEECVEGKDVKCGINCTRYCKDHLANWLQIVLSKIHATLYSHPGDFSKLDRIFIRIKESGKNKEWMEFETKRASKYWSGNDKNNEYSMWKWNESSRFKQGDVDIISTRSRFKSYNDEIYDKNVSYDDVFKRLKMFNEMYPKNIRFTIMYSFREDSTQDVVHSFNMNGWDGTDHHFSKEFRW